MAEDRMILDRDVPEERARLRLGTNPLDNDAVSEFTLEAELERIANLMKTDGPHREENIEIKRLVKQAEEDRDKMSERGLSAYEYLQSKKNDWDR